MRTRRLHKSKNSKNGLITAANNIIDNIRTNRIIITKKQMERKTIVWIFQATNWRNLTREDVYIARKGEP